MNVFSIRFNSPILLLNSDYNPIHITSWRRAVVLVLKNKAEIISSQVIRLIQYIQIPFSRLLSCKPTKNAIFKRDDYRCQYCGSLKNLTLDHVIPQSQGGGNTWTNLVTACVSCNARKGNQSLAESGMHLYQKPSAPFNRIQLVLQKSNVSEWKRFIYV